MPRTLLALLALSPLALAAPVPKAVKKVPAYPYEVGTKWEYIRNGDKNKVYVEEVTESEEKDGVIRFKVDVTTDSGGKMFEKYVIKDGELALTATLNGEYDPPMLIRKDKLTAGDEWATRWGYKGGGEGAEVEETLVVGKAEELTTPAGKFTAFPVTRKRQGRAGTVMWYADGVGMVRHTEPGVKEPVQELKAFTLGKGK